MASIQRSAEKSLKDQKSHDQSRIMAGHMLTFDYLVNQDMAERQIARKVVRKNLIRSAGCLTLPLTVAYFAIYVLAIRLHEDITNVFFAESGMRTRTDSMFINANTAEDLWSVLLSPNDGNFLSVFFSNQDMYGNTMMSNVSMDQWGDRGLVTGYNQIQGAVRFSTSRLSTQAYGRVYNCTNELTCRVCGSNEGFQSVKSFAAEPPRDHDCGSWPNRRLDTQDAEVAAPAPERRLHLVRPELRTSFPSEAKNADDQFRFWLYPSDSTQQVQEKLRYFWERGWIDQETTRVTVKMYIMNPELGRNRLEELEMRFYFSEAGSVYYERELQTIFLQFWQSNMSMFADFGFFMLLLITTVYRVWGMWKAFLQSKLFNHLMNLGTAWEWLMILIGWWNMYGFWKMLTWEKSVIAALEPVHRRGWEIGPADEDLIMAMFDAAETASKGLANLRVVFAQYSVVLMFRFFVSFGTQPRLAVVLKTMRNVLTDVVHFAFVFLPTFTAYVISASLMFGRRVESFATIQGSFGAVFRIALESEYEWGELSEQYFWAAALWAWSFLLLIVLLFLNMVVAIILDIYNETREGSFPGEAIWETIGTMFLRVRKLGKWIPDKQLEEFFVDELGDKSIVTRRDMEERFTQMPASQNNLFFSACRTEMTWESAKDLGKKNLLKLTGTVMDALDHTHNVVGKITEDDSGDPLQAWVKPMQPADFVQMNQQSTKEMNQQISKGTERPKVHVQNSASDSFLVSPIITKGGKQPLFQSGKTEVKDSYSATGSEWLRETWQLLHQQRAWLEYANWNLEQMQWQVQKAHESKLKDSSANAPSVNIL